jgi:DUF3011 family protein
MMKKLLILAIALAASVPAWGQQTVVCESSDGKYKECDIGGIGRVVLSRQISDKTCIEGKSWGTRDGVVWVDRGCRAEFALADRGFDNRGNRVRRIERRGVRQSTVTCESTDGKRHRCSVDTQGGVSLVNQLSRNSCEFGRDWGYDNNGVWVNNGCRAEFAISNRASDLSTTAGTLLCESTNNGRNRCRADTMYGVQIYRQLSENDCILGRTWGYDKNGVWVSGGCRAEFMIGDTRRTTGMASSSSRATTLICESKNNGRDHCRADTRYGVSLTRQLSKNSCEFRKDWGFDQDSIWVDHGCRAEFALEGR